MDIDSFYLDLPIIEDFVEVSNPRVYTRMPDHWHVVVTDVKDSTGIIQQGGYKIVNLLGASSIMAILNLRKSFSLPFIFGGDGATICIDDSLVQEARKSLVATKIMASEVYGLELRVGIVPLEEIRRNGHDVLVARYRISEHFVQAVFSGGGLQYAEDTIKDPDRGSRFRLNVGDAEPVADFTGLECRWQNVPSPRGEVVTIIVQALSANAAQRSRAYREVINAIAAIYGTDAVCRPVRETDLSTTLREKQLAGESGVRSFGKGKLYRIWYWFRIRYGVLAGWYLMKFRRRTKKTNWGEYKKQLAANTDYKKFDDKLRQVLSGSKEQRKKLEEFLTERFDRHELVFGIHAAPTALVTCLIFNYNGAHIHLVDSDDGGYAVAAAKLKIQLRELTGR